MSRPNDGPPPPDPDELREHRRVNAEARRKRERRQDLNRREWDAFNEPGLEPHMNEAARYRREELGVSDDAFLEQIDERMSAFLGPDPLGPRKGTER